MKRFMFALALVALVLASCSDETPSTGRTPPTSPPSTPSGPLLVYSTTANCPSSSCAAAEWTPSRKDDLWIYNIATAAHERLTSGGQKLVEVLPRFTPRNTVSFVEGSEESKPGSALFETDLNTKASTELFRVSDGDIFRYDWHPDGGSVAFLNFDEEGGSALRIWTRSDGKVRTLKTYPQLLGRGVGLDDEVSVAWSPDGKSILVVDTFRDPPLKDTMWVLDLQGKDVVPPRAGTFGRWSGDSAAVYYKDHAGSGDWFRLTLAGNKKTTLKIPDQRYNPAVSPDGKLLALNGGGSKPSVYLFDTAAGTESKIGAGVVPVWISDTEVAVTDVRPCGAEEECFEGPPWKPTATASKLTVSAEEAEVLFPGWTLNADVRLG